MSINITITNVEVSRGLENLEIINHSGLAHPIAEAKSHAEMGLDPSGWHKFRNTMEFHYSFTGNDNGEADYIKWQMTTGNNVSGVPYYVDTGDSISGLSSGSGVYSITLDYPSGFFGANAFESAETGRTLDDKRNLVCAQGIKATGAITSPSGIEHSGVGDNGRTGFVARANRGTGIAGNALMVEGYSNHANSRDSETVIYIGGTSATTLATSGKSFLVEIPAGLFGKNEIIIENKVNSFTGAIIDLMGTPEIYSVTPSIAAWGEQVQVSGINFVDVRSVTLNNLQISGYAVTEPTGLTFNVPYLGTGNEPMEGDFDLRITATGGTSI